jgi:hypothetical protein
MRVEDRAAPEPQVRAKAPVTIEYAHLPLGEDVIAFAGYYTPEKEALLRFRGRDVLYVTGHIVVEATCHEGGCAAANYWYAIVPGYVLRWQYRRNESGLPVTEVEPIADRETQKEIERLLLEREAVARVDFR